jgi:hypothetical protein
MLCYGQLAVWWVRNWNFFRMAVDVVSVIAPTFLRFAETTKQKLFSPEPGADTVRKAANGSRRLGGR